MMPHYVDDGGVLHIRDNEDVVPDHTPELPFRVVDGGLEQLIIC